MRIDLNVFSQMVAANLPRHIEKEVAEISSHRNVVEQKMWVRIRFWNRHTVNVPINENELDGYANDGTLPFDLDNTVALCTMVYDLPRKKDETVRG